MFTGARTYLTNVMAIHELTDGPELPDWTGNVALRCVAFTRHAQKVILVLYTN